MFVSQFKHSNFGFELREYDFGRGDSATLCSLCAPLREIKNYLIARSISSAVRGPFERSSKPEGVTR